MFAYEFVTESKNPLAKELIKTVVECFNQTNIKSSTSNDGTHVSHVILSFLVENMSVLYETPYKRSTYEAMLDALSNLTINGLDTGSPMARSIASVPKASDAAKKLAMELGIDLNTIIGTGTGGLITVTDVKNAQ